MQTLVIAGGGVAAVEAALAARSTAAADQLNITLLCPEEHFNYKPLSVLAPFGGPGLELSLHDLARDLDLHLHQGRLVEVEPTAHRAITDAGEEIPYSALLVATGAVPGPALSGAEHFAGPVDAKKLEALLMSMELGAGSVLAFVATPDHEWTLPLYELAMLAAKRLKARAGGGVTVRLVTAEHDPLECMDPESSDLARMLLARAEVGLTTDVVATRVENRVIHVKRGASIPADQVVTLASLTGPRIRGLKQDRNGFVTIDRYGRVRHAKHVYAAGDITRGFPKQGGLAARQADAAVAMALATMGFDSAPQPFDDSLEGIILLPHVLEKTVSGDAWQPPAKIVAPFLSDYLRTRAANSALWAGGSEVPSEIELPV